MSHKIAYLIASIMVAVAVSFLYVNQDIFNSWQRLLILLYMIIYGALMAWSDKK